MSSWYVKGEDLKNLKHVMDSEFKSLRDEINKLKIDISRNVTEDEVEIQRILSVSKDKLANIESLQDQINGFVDLLSGMSNEATSEKEKFEEIRLELETSRSTLNERISHTKVAFDEMVESRDSIQSSRVQVDEELVAIRGALQESTELPDNVEEITSLLDEAKQKEKQLSDLISHSMKKKSDIDSMHKDILGYSIENDLGEIEKIEGLRDELENAYSGLSSRSMSLKEEVDESVTEVISHYKDEVARIESENSAIIEASNLKVKTVSDQLTGLLPGAMAEGLSAAYDKKKAEEIESQKNLEITFRRAITVLVIISLIPFFVDIYLVGYLKQELISVVKDTPSLLISILPLYFPIFWLAYSTNKKLNLSKRLIEEYTHKSVLGKTFDGLSNQIESLPSDGNMRDELRAKLLFNLLQVSSENPGKLITNYDKSDHPLMEALENSSKLSDSVEALSRLPGFSSIAGKLSERSEQILNNQKQKVEDGISVHNVLDTPVGEELSAGQRS